MAVLLVFVLLASAGCSAATQAPAEPAATEAPAQAESKPLRVALYAQYIQWFPLEQALKDFRLRLYQWVQ